MIFCCCCCCFCFCFNRNHRLSHTGQRFLKHTVSLRILQQQLFYTLRTLTLKKPTRNRAVKQNRTERHLLVCCFKTFVSSEARHQRPLKWRSIEKTRRKVRWVLAVCCFPSCSAADVGPCWCFYRKKNRWTRGQPRKRMESRDIAELQSADKKSADSVKFTVSNWKWRRRRRDTDCQIWMLLSVMTWFYYY